MPPRKSDVRASTPVAAEETSPPAKPQQEKKDKEKEKDAQKGKGEDAVTIEDLNLPKSIITRLAKGSLPPNTQIQGNAILALSKSATVFISYLASHANENTVAAGKKTISPADVFKALDDTEFSFLKEPLEAEFAKFTAVQAEKRTTYRQKVRATKPSSGDGGDDTEMADTTVASEEASASSGPRAKKARVDPSAAAEDEEIDAIVDDDDVEEEDDGDEEAHDDDDAEEEEEAGDEDEDEEREASGDETQDALEERRSREDAEDEALEGDESD
ncbi:histone-fold-containing protein [Trichoderma evansii]